MAAKGWGKSKVTKESLLPYISTRSFRSLGMRDGECRRRTRWSRAEAWGVRALHELPRPRVRLPTSDFLRQLLAFYNIKISDLGPHSVQQIALFVALCECYLGCPPYFPLWVSIFHGRATRVSKNSEALIPNGGITFQVKSGESFIDMALPKKAQSQWRRFWFYASTHARGSSHSPDSPEPSTPRRLNVRSLPHDQEEVVKEMRLAIQALKNDGLTAADMYNCWLARRLIPLRSAPITCGSTGRTNAPARRCSTGARTSTGRYSPRSPRPHSLPSMTAQPFEDRPAPQGQDEGSRKPLPRRSDGYEEAEARKATEMKKAAPDPMGMASSKGQTATAAGPRGRPRSKGPVAGGVASASASGAGSAGSNASRWARAVRSCEGGCRVEKAQDAGGDHQVVPPPTKRSKLPQRKGLSGEDRERRTKAAQDPARPTERDEPVEEAPSRRQWSAGMPRLPH
ncbi:hypothetical protein QYE76_017230 [Lolium multiflorum]|uniref:Transposase (putative) gypsy type domain-containing protein n=1 Tax=Lolium multiflorum TaxID=4521 RepID=A0AAD8QEM9_LOLMU|nr:hypothetical protein QYE76_017230 [Lolium multiflorum]